MKITKKEFYKELDDSIQMYKYDPIYFPKRFPHNGYMYIMESNGCRKEKSKKEVGFINEN